jgi:hypothetical protein
MCGTESLYEYNENFEIPLHIALRGEKPTKLALSIIGMMGQRGLNTVDAAGMLPVTIAEHRGLSEVQDRLSCVVLYPTFYSLLDTHSSTEFVRQQWNPEIISNYSQKFFITAAHFAAHNGYNSMLLGLHSRDTFGHTQL